MADFLAEKRREAEQRLKELRPAYDEYQQLERFLSVLDQSQPRRGPGRPRGSATTRRARSGNGRRRRGGTRADQALRAVRQNPGITVAELAKKVGIKQKNYLYRVMNGLEAQGAVRKEGRGYRAV
jgi:Winged helix-turn-helix DNA-binding